MLAVNSNALERWSEYWSSTVAFGPQPNEHLGGPSGVSSNALERWSEHWPCGDGVGAAPTEVMPPRRILPVLVFLVAVIVLVSVPRLPPYICYGDAGDLQLASASLGITHPPGYAGFVSLGYMATLIPGVDPAYAVSVFCMATGIIVLILCVLFQVRLGVNPWAAGTVALLLTAHPRFWMNLTTPEVYMPALAFIVGAAYLVLKYAQGGRRRDVYIAGFLFGVALANRPPVLLILPFFVTGWWLAARRWELPERPSEKSFLVILGCAMLPGLYSLGYLWVRDTPQTPYNYLEHHTAEYHELPQSNAGWPAKLERVTWQASAKQFHYRVGNDWRGVRTKLRWLRIQLVAYDALPYSIMALLGIFGIVMVFQRCLISGILLCGMCIQSVFFVCMFRDVGQAADLMPLLFALAVFGGVTLSTLLPINGDARRKLFARALMIAITVLTVLNVPHRSKYGASLDATAFLDEVDLKTFPQRSVIFAKWNESLPLLYEQYILGTRPDINIVIANPGNWLRMAEGFPDHPVFLVGKDSSFKDRVVTPFRNVWRLE